MKRWWFEPVLARISDDEMLAFLDPGSGKVSQSMGRNSLALARTVAGVAARLLQAESRRGGVGVAVLSAFALFPRFSLRSDSMLATFKDAAMETRGPAP